MTLNPAWPTMNTAQPLPVDIRWMNSVTSVLAVVMLLLGLAAVLGVAARQPRFAIEQLTLQGDLQRNSLVTVKANVVQRLHGGFFTVDLRQVREVFETVPWVRRAVVRRVWPNELRVTLEEHQPAAYWRQDDHDDQLVNMQGEVFDANLGDVEDTPPPVLYAPTRATPDQARQMLAMLRRLRPVLASLPQEGRRGAEIKLLKLTDRGSWVAHMDNETQLELGRGDTEDVVARAERFVRTLPQLHRQYPFDMAYVDLRYPRGYAVRFKGMNNTQEISAAATAAVPAQ